MRINFKKEKFQLLICLSLVEIVKTVSFECEWFFIS